MSEFLAPHTLEYSIKVPHDPLAIALWILWFSGLIFLAVRYRTKQSTLDKKKLIWLAVLSLSVLILTPFFGIPMDNNNLEGVPQFFILFAAVPWLVAGGVIGTLSAVFVACMSGLLTAYLDTHSIFTPLVFMTASLTFSLCVRQRYRAFAYQLLRFPLIASLTSSLVTLPFFLLALLLSGSDELAVRIAAVVGGQPEASFAFMGMMLIGGAVCVFIMLIARKVWGKQETSHTAEESGATFRWTLVTLPLIAVMLLGLAFGGWSAAEKRARRSMVDRLTSTADAVSANLNLYIGTGKYLLGEAAENDALLTGSADTLPDQLAKELTMLPFFDRLAILNPTGEMIAVYPTGNLELTGDAISTVVASAEDDVVIFPSVSTPGEEDETVILHFVTGLSASSGQIDRVLVGQSAIEDNPYYLPVLGVLDEMAANGGTAQIVSEDGTILFHTDSQQVMATYTGVSYATATFSEEVSSGGQAWTRFYQPVGETGWAVVTAFPDQVVQTAAWETITSVLCYFIIGALILGVYLLILLAFIKKAVKQVEETAEKFIQGDYQVEFSSHRSICGTGHLEDTLKRMAVSLQGKERKQSDILSLTERITGQLSLKDSLQIILMAALERNVSSARIVLLDASENGTSDSPEFQYGLGEHTRQLSPLDSEILTLAQSQGTFVFRASQIERMLDIQKGMPLPASLIAMPLKWKESWLGVLWVAYKDQPNPGSLAVEFFTDLSTKASVAIINARAFDKSITIKNQLENVLDVMHDPVLISDDFGRIVYLNKAAQAMIGHGNESKREKSLSAVFQEKRLLTLLHDARYETRSDEIKLENSRTYHITANPIQIEDRKIGLAVIFKDVTAYKTREYQNSELITTVNHELRAPLTLVQGYAKLLRLTGNLNDQQSTFINKIIDGMEEMKTLVQNLLDLDRLESADRSKLTQVDAGALVKSVVEGFAAQSKRKNIHIAVSLPDEPVALAADEAYLTQALKNLVDNAIKFSKMGSSVQVSLRREEGSAVFSIQDHGIGIAPLDQKHLFEKFNRVNIQTGEEEKGSGLGLAIVKSIAARHHGRVWVDSKLGQGSTFYLRIPLIKE